MLKNSVLLLSILITSLFFMVDLCSAAGQSRIFGTGKIKNAFFRILINERSKNSKGTLKYMDRQQRKMIFGEITILTAESPNKISFSGTSVSVDKSTLTFHVVVEDLGKRNEGKDKFSITLSDGYTNSGDVVKGDIRIEQ